MIGVGVGIILLWVLIFPLTDGYVRFFSSKTIKKGSEPGTGICLTFDDGPDPRYTPKVLKILRELHIPAVFFLVGAKAEQSPDLVKRIEAEGHEIGCHTYYHRHAYLLSPQKSIATICEGQQAIEKIIKKPLKWFRPPWGALNLFQYLFIKYTGLRIVLWDANARDWKKQTGVSGITKMLFRKIKPNSIIVLHDSGGDMGAPENTVASLPGIITKLQSDGYSFVTLEKVLGGKKNDKCGIY